MALTEANQDSLWSRVRYKIIGSPRDPNEPSLFHKLSLIPLLAWIGLGADGLSSSSYGPEEAFKSLGTHIDLAVFLAIATALTVFIISYAYSRIIEHFPHGGGGYIVASHTISKEAGVLSGCALLVDYVLTITVSLASCGDALFSFLPVEFQKLKVFFVILLIIFLIIINLRGVKESVTILAPIFIIFVVTHVLLLGYGFITHLGEVGTVAREMHGNLSSDLRSVGFFAMLAIFLRAFSLGGGTYTGLEAVSNGMQIMREPPVQTGKRTMLYMAVSLAVTAGGLLVCYLLFHVKPVEGRTLNAILADGIFAQWPKGHWIAFITLLSEGALLIVGAQTGFIDGPRVMANMAIDQWLPRRFSSLSERLTMQNGVIMMGVASLLLLFYTRGSVTALVIMYSINVFLTFSLSQFGMIRFYLKNKETEPDWKQHMSVHCVGLIVCATILTVTVSMKFGEGGWVTLLITTALVLLCFMIKGHYKKVGAGVRSFDEILANVKSTQPVNTDPPDPRQLTAVVLVGGYGGFGVHAMVNILTQFPKVFRNFIFVSVAELDSGAFKGIKELEALKKSTEDGLKKYVEVARSLGLAADYRIGLGADVVEIATRLCEVTVKEFPRSTVFAGKLVFKKDHFFQKILHNETANAIQRRLQWDGIMMMILPIRVSI
ncbi:MAG: APC family permease [Syntrophales bacterium]